MPERLTCRTYTIVLYGVFSVALCLGQLGCRSAVPSTLTETPKNGATDTLSPADTQTPTPSPTSEPPVVLLLAPPDSDVVQVTGLQALLVELAAKDGLDFETQSEFVDPGAGADIRLVVVLPPDPGVGNLAAAFPETQFLAVGIADLEPSPNLSLIGSEGERPDQQGFLAGYLAAVLTHDWRVGVISLSDTTGGRAARRGFVNGAIFYCGLCRPAYPPFLQYPIFVEIPGGASREEQQVAADVLINSAVKTVFVFAGAGDVAMLETLAQADIHIIGEGTPPEQVKNSWVASVRVDLLAAIEQIWTDLINGRGGISVGIPLLLSDRNEDLFSPGRQRLVEKMLAELLAGFIDTGVDPLTGEGR